MEDKKIKVLDFIKHFNEKFGYNPTVREICKEFNFTSTSTGAYYLNKLKRENLITSASGKNRAIKVISDKQSFNNNQFLVVGKVAAGKPILATENIENNIDMPPELFGKNTGDIFILKVSGDSMINAGIFNGDMIVVKKQEMAENGEIVVAMIDDSVTVKRFYKEKDYIRLEPENDFMESIIATNCSVIGKVVGLIRQKIK